MIPPVAVNPDVETTKGVAASRPVESLTIALMNLLTKSSP
jgi:hypothetical protein